MAAAGARLDGAQTARLKQAAATIGLNGPRANGVQRQAAAIICRDLAADRELPANHRLAEVSDYLAGQARQPDGAVTARTAGGLVKASNRWHRQLRRRQAEPAWNARLKLNRGRYRAWNDLLGSLNLNGYDFVPLTDAQALFQEGHIMQHCVGYADYDDECARGHSRIFSVRSNGQRAATTQLALRNGEWQPAQTAGPANAKPDAEILHAAQSLAAIYQREYRKAGQQSLHAWETAGQAAPAL